MADGGAEVIAPDEPSEQDLEILNKRAMGHTTHRLAREYKLTVKEVHAALDRAIPKIDADYARRELGVQLHLLDTLTRPLAEKARTGDPQAVTALMRLAERRAAVLGWDVAPSFRRDPVTIQIEQTPQKSSTERIWEAIQRIKAEKIEEQSIATESVRRARQNGEPAAPAEEPEGH
jgi:hypothetical protein